MISDNSRSITKRFASALDRCDFQEAGGFLSADCHYEIRDKVLIGPEAILASYSESAEWASKAFEQVTYESEVEEGDDRSLSILYTDRLIHKGRMYEHRSRQRVWLNEEGKVVRILHEDLPGERERLDEFLKRCGIRR